MTGRKILLVVDAQRDFIDGSLAVPEADKIIPEINVVKGRFDKVYFTLDWHPKDHCSFKENGGTWPEHCVHYTLGASLACGLLDGLDETKTRFILKGRDKDREEYGAFADIAAVTQPKTGTGTEMSPNAAALDLFQPGDEVTVCGIAAEYCVLETLKNVHLLSQEIGFHVNIFMKGVVGFDCAPLLAWMTENSVDEY